MKKIEAKATELWDQVKERRNEIEQAPDEIHHKQWVTGKQQDTYQENNNVALNKVMHVVDNLLGETADHKSFSCLPTLYVEWRRTGPIRRTVTRLPGPPYAGGTKQPIRVLIQRLSSHMQERPCLTNRVRAAHMEALIPTLPEHELISPYSEEFSGRMWPIISGRPTKRIPESAGSCSHLRRDTGEGSTTTV